MTEQERAVAAARRERDRRAAMARNADNDRLKTPAERAAEQALAESRRRATLAAGSKLTVRQHVENMVAAGSSLVKAYDRAGAGMRVR